MSHTQRKENERRVKNAENALKQYTKADPFDRQSIVIDLLTDLRHYCAAHIVDFEYCIRVSGTHHEEEKIPRSMKLEAIRDAIDLLASYGYRSGDIVEGLEDVARDY